MLLLHPLDRRFPTRLSKLEPPDLLAAEGPLEGRLDTLGPSVAIVGTRRPSAEALAFTTRLAMLLAQAEVLVVSGGALGIDTAAHEAALSAGGRTLAVLPGAIDAWVPAANASLFRRVRETGALVAITQRGRKPRFHARNGVIAALADDVVVTAAPVESGARNTANWARRLGRRLWIVPGAPWDPTMAGCALELTIGAATALSSPEQLLRQLFPSQRVPRRRATTVEIPLPFAGEPSIRDAILSRLREGPASIDALVAFTTRQVGDIAAALSSLLLDDAVRECGDGRFTLSSR